MVESDPATTLLSSLPTMSTLMQQKQQQPPHYQPHYQPLIAQWNDFSGTNHGNNNNNNNNNTSCIWSLELQDEQQQQQQQQQPHVSIKLPPQDPRLPAMSISRCNRDSTIVATTSSNDQHPPSLHGSDVSSQESSLEDDEGNTNDNDNHDDDDDDHAAGSVFWSQSGAGGAVMPEIVELSVSIKVDAESHLRPALPPPLPSRRKHHDHSSSTAIRETPSLLDSSASSDSWDDDDDELLRMQHEHDNDHDENDDHLVSSESIIYQIGIAYLVLFGNDGGTTIMDLPIKRLQKTATSTMIRVEDTASLRVRVNVYPSGEKQKKTCFHTTSTTTTTTTTNCRRNPATMGQLRRQAHQLHDTNVLEPILRQLKVADDKKAATAAANQETSSKRGADNPMCAAVPKTAAAPPPPTSSTAAVLCGTMPQFMDFLYKFVLPCNDGADGILVPKRRGDDDDSMDSTIRTAPSMTFW